MLVYKVDRLTRSLADFAKIVELFDRIGSRSCRSHSIQHHQFHGAADPQRPAVRRPVRARGYGERIRDKIAASKAKGIWMGGSVPLGYVSVNKKLVVVPQEAETVRQISPRYLSSDPYATLSRT